MKVDDVAKSLLVENETMFRFTQVRKYITDDVPYHLGHVSYGLCHGGYRFQGRTINKTMISLIPNVRQTFF